MNELINCLRLQTAQLNNFLIENYLGSIKTKEGYNEPYTYIFNSFINLSESLKAVGTGFSNLDNIQIGEVSQLKEAIKEVANIIYLIEKAADIDELALIIKGIHTITLDSSITNVIVYGKKFGKNKAEVEAEIEQIKQDNTDYFDTEGAFKYAGYQTSQQEAIAYLSSNANILQVKNSFKKANQTWQYLSSLVTNWKSKGKNCKTDETFIAALLNTLTLILIALGYLEPFFRKTDSFGEFFETKINDISATQAAFKNYLDEYK